MDAIDSSIDRSALLEYTVEGGRPDTLSAEKFSVIAAHGAGRVSINPQSMNGAVLRRVGRLHDADMIVRSYEQARQAGFSSVYHFSKTFHLLTGQTPSSFAAATARGTRLSLTAFAKLAHRDGRSSSSPFCSAL